MLTYSFFKIIYSSLEWSDEPKVARAEILRLIYQGRFLHGSVSLDGKVFFLDFITNDFLLLAGWLLF